MIDHPSATYRMSMKLENAKESYTKNGFLFPTLILLSRGRPIHVKIKDEVIIDTHVREEPHEGTDIYTTILMLNSRDEKDDVAAQQLARKLVEDYDPDVVGMILKCIYKEYKSSKDIPKGSLALEPEAIDCLHVCYYTREDPTPVMKYAPFLDRGKRDLKPDEVGDSDFETASEDMDLRPHDVTFMDVPWTEPTNLIGPRLECPYIHKEMK